ncbi:hypothetical protein [Halomonas ventosae]|uniref:Uncharacterized protein n=1 Tax=Halomonas ventosae TaxID=229007 RepID=A0A2T0VQ37_9GAMM|nr:hypothetical protein [Halomonas ventosae]PRY72444.1 hypothetical protein BCL64_104272 [Halomonas ventosae]
MAEEDDTRLEAKGRPNSESGAPSGSQKKDQASDPDYDQGKKGKKKRDLDDEILSRRKIGKFMSIAAVAFMGLFTFAFFLYAIRFAHRFIAAYRQHIGNWVDNGSTPDMSSVLPLMVPMVPAFFFSVLGLATMITCIRFITAYVNPQDENEDGALIERLVREVAGAIRSLKSGGGE